MCVSQHCTPGVACGAPEVTETRKGPSEEARSSRRQVVERVVAGADRTTSDVVAARGDRERPLLAYAVGDQEIGTVHDDVPLLGVGA